MLSIKVTNKYNKHLSAFQMWLQLLMFENSITEVLKIEIFCFFNCIPKYKTHFFQYKTLNMSATMIQLNLSIIISSAD